MQHVLSDVRRRRVDFFLTKSSNMGNNHLSGITLEQSRVVVAGGTSGIGFAVAEAAAHSGAEVIIASSSPERVAAALAILPTRHK
jgi:NADPH:quinone reductase-like Zn-dependent oxidoreductase